MFNGRTPLLGKTLLRILDNYFFSHEFWKRRSFSPVLPSQPLLRICFANNETVKDFTVAVELGSKQKASSKDKASRV